MKVAQLCLPLIAASWAVPASAQVMPDVIGQAIAERGSGPANKCYERVRTPSANDISRASARADKAFQEYVTLAATRANLKAIFYGKQNWAIDGAVRDAAGVIDPWADRVARVERTSLTLANVGSPWFRGVWNAYAADGSLLGTYDAMLEASDGGSAGFISLALFSPGSAAELKPVAPFCQRPGDIELWKTANAQREAAKAARQAQRAERATR